MTQVNLIHLSKIYEGTDIPALQDLSLELTSGRITAVLGPSGCGKTTLLKLIAGLLYPSQGDIIFDDQSVLPVPAERRGAVMVFQNHLLFPYLSVAENVGFGLKMQGVDRQTISCQPPRWSRNSDHPPGTCTTKSKWIQAERSRSHNPKLPLLGDRRTP